MSKLSTYLLPSIRERIKTAPDFRALYHLRGMIQGGLELKVIDAKDSTVESWADEIWCRVLDLIKQARTPSEVAFIRNSTLRWPRSDWVNTILESCFAARFAALPSDAERLLSYGIEIQGVTRLQSTQNLELKRSAISRAL